MARGSGSCWGWLGQRQTWGHVWVEQAGEGVQAQADFLWKAAWFLDVAKTTEKKGCPR